MPEREDAHLEVLSDAEREALERPGLKQRARAIAAATEFATKLGLSEDTLAVMVGRLRTLNKPHARLAWETLGNANELLEMLFIDGPLVEESPKAITDEIAEVTEPQVDAAEQSSSDEGEDWFESKPLDFLRVSNFYKAINDKTSRERLSVPEDVSTIDRDELVGLVALYGAQHKMPKVANRQIDALHDNFLEGTESDSYINGVRYTVTNRIAELLDHIDDEVSVVSSVEPERKVDAEKAIPLQGNRKSEVTVPLREVIERLADGEEDRSYRQDRVESLMDQLRRRGVDLQQLTAEDFDNAILVQLAIMYAESVTSSREIIETNIACTWGWLSGVEMEDLVHMRKATKADASSVDVHNSRTAFLEGVRKGAERGMRIELTELSVDEGDDELEEEAYAPQVEPLHSVPPLEEGDEVVARHERSIEEEPKHVQIAAAYIERLELGAQNQRALEELLNPDARGDVTKVKTVVLERLKHRIGMVSADGGVINQLEVSPRAKNAVRQLFGMGFVKHGHVVERESIVLKDQLRNIAASDRQAYMNDFYTGLEALLDELVTPEEEPESKAPLRVIFGDDGEVQLA